MTDTPFSFRSIGTIRSPYTEKFGIPRQPGLASAARLELWLSPDLGMAAVEGLSGFSHLWIHFIFHEHLERGWQPRVRPPRLGGNQKLGVLATRSPFRPNPLGLSVVPLLGIEEHQGQVCLILGAADLLDGTPVVDIKPYIPFVDSIADAVGGFAETPPPAQAVSWSAAARQQMAALENDYPTLQPLIEQVLAQDPRPAYQKQTGREYGIRLYDINIRFVATAEGFEIIECAKATP
ncbi:tRNA (N6-threonylcarbamoyladenosine(37)-N6)-methyltransferase TrmO [Pokkaliibacter sp. CJK22405]|uniref:tRNA (N6-threonylcarbamoyladenosine(37)-N6)-methyltransferase TrmO n=1 Tax=Pokkaliibacter sp. CJK22405 TaxID=3384615 RepID=UPI0039846BD5